MRVCLFSPSLEPLLRPEVVERVRRAFAPVEPEIILLTNSWADIPPGSDVYVTAGARTWGMRALRFAGETGSLGWATMTRTLAPLVGPAIVEALRAADPDVVVCTSEAAASQLRLLLHRTHGRWPCVTVGEAFPTASVTRCYDPGAKVSIVLPTYNGSRFLREAISSCLTQTHRNIELLIVDDGSREPAADTAREFGDARLRLIRHAQNKGLPHSLNTGFSHATGDFFTWTSDDNLYMPDAIEQMVRCLNTYTDVGFVYAESFRIDASGQIDSVAPVLRTRPPESLAVDNFIGACFLYRRVVHDVIGQYDPAAALAEDYDYWIRVARRFTMQRLFRRLYCYRFHDASLTARCDRRVVEQRANAVRRQFHEGFSWTR
jgi:GT2 family glycosyltransferase